jgi:hypothetical protein
MGGLDKGEVPSVRGENGSDPQPLGNGDKGRVDKPDSGTTEEVRLRALRQKPIPCFYMQLFALIVTITVHCGKWRTGALLMNNFMTGSPIRFPTSFRP